MEETLPESSATASAEAAPPARHLLREVRGSVGLVLGLLWLGVVGPFVLFLAIVPATWLFPRYRVHVVSWFMRLMSRGILAGLAVGGARWRRTGVLPTEGAGLIVMNHQSLIDILIATLMARPFAPTFVTRELYARHTVPVVSTTVRLLGCPIIDPRRDPRGAVDILKKAVIGANRTLLIFPEGHRTRTGDILPFRPGGMVAMLTEARMPVYLVATDGYWRSPTLVDFVRNVQHIRGVTELVGRYDPPADPAELPAFCERLRDDLVARLAEMRSRPQ